MRKVKRTSVFSDTTPLGVSVRKVSKSDTILTMKALASTLLTLFCALPGALAAQRDYPVKPVPFTSVHVRDSFWAPRIETNRKVTIPFAFRQDEETGRVDNFERAAKALRGEPLANRTAPGYPFDDTDLYKVIEGASYALSVQPDPQLDAYLDKLIAIIAAAQERDGYLYTTRSIDPAHPHEWAGERRWMNERDLSHELYNLGHLYEAAVAHHQATGKRTLLDVALRTADLLDRTFGPGKEVIWPGHQITEMGLAKLFRATGDERYLKMAKFLLDVRGPDGHKASGREYNQSHAKVIEQTEAVGHAVRATYMYSGMADVAALTGDRAYADAIARIWENVVAKKLYITGGIGATNHGEAFGANYELPNMTAYNETCAAIGSDYWNHRLFLMNADARYIDVLERTLYNGTISGVSLDGKGFFYPNPLESNGQHARSPWFGCACCPGNITRFLASVPGYVYAQSGSGIWVNLFVASDAKIALDDGQKVTIAQETRYPWDGAVRLKVGAGRYALRLRIPGWARSQPVPSDLYRYVDQAPGGVGLKVNGRAVELKLEKGYAVLDREWKQGDTVDLLLPMAVRRVASHEAVAANRGRVAVERGPIVYAAEWADNPGGKVRHLMLEDSAPLAAEHHAELLGGVTVVKTKAVALKRRTDASIEKTVQELTLIPYATWANRGKGQMMVWLPREEKAARPLPFPLPSMTAEVKTSGKKNARMMQDGEVPSSSSDPSSYFDWWPEKGRAEWVEYTFAQPVTLSRSRVYWFDDTGRGEVRVPAGWRLLYRHGEEWKPVAGVASYGVEKDRYNEVTFAPVTTRALRLEVTAQPQWSAGIQEWEAQ